MTIIGVVVHLFVPHHSNNHRSKVLHVESLLVYVLVFAILNLGVRILHRTMPDVLGYATDIHVEQLLSETNGLRQGAGLAPLALNQQLSAAAAQKAQDMFAKGYWAHNSPSGATPWDFISQAGYKYTVAGENLAKNFSTSKGVIDAWMASPTHRDNILKPAYREVGFAVVNGILNGEETTLVVQMFGASSTPLAIAPPKPAVPVAVSQKAAVTEKPLQPTKAPAREGATPLVTPTAAPLAPPVLAYGKSIEPISSAFLGVTKQPAINIPSLTRDIVFVFAGVILGVLALDAWIVSRRRVVRVAGHNIAHFLFLSAMVIAASMVGRGSLI